ncbi:peptidoglycan DD-metalloendopeptidase family protein [Lentimicrobium sp.]
MSGFSTPLKAQDKKSELSKQKAKIEADISYTNKLLDETKKDKRESVNALQLLNKQITKREELIRAITSELNQLNQSINRTNDTILELTKTIKKLKDEYARMIFYAGKNRNSYSRLMFIFSAKDFNQAYQRLKYLQQYTSYRQNQVRIIKESQVILNQKVALLEEQKKEKQSLIDLEKSEQHKLSQARSLQEKAVKNLSQKEKELLKKIRESEKAAKRLQKAIEDLIAEEIRKATAEAKKAGTKPAPENKFGLTPEEARLSANFADNQGRLPWPTERGIIAETFGEHAHPVLRGIKTKNNGIDIATEKGSIARAIFDGQVTSTMTLPNYNNVVIVRHGEFLTVYSNLEQIFVKKGDKVSVKQKIGIISTDDNGRTLMHFELWKGKNLQNPENWIMRGK